MANPGGVKLNLGGREFIVPALSLRQVRAFSEDGTLEKIQAIGNRLPTAEEIGAVVTLVHSALARRYSVTPDEILDLIDMGNIGDVFLAVCLAAGMEKVKPGEAESPKAA